MFEDELISLREMLRSLGFTDIDARFPHKWLRKTLLHRINTTMAGSGRSLGSFPPPLLHMILGGLDAKALVRVGNTSRSMYHQCQSPRLWQTLVLEKHRVQGSLCGLGTSLIKSNGALWKQSFCALKNLDRDPKWVLNMKMLFVPLY